MVTNPPEGYQRIIPYIVYEDAASAIERMCEGFGFTKLFAMDNEDGTIGHAEISLQGNVVMLATAVPDMGHGTPKKLGASHGSILVYVDDVDAHYAHAKAAGMEVGDPPEDQFYGDRQYRYVDPEGHHWYFHTHVKDVDSSDAGAPG